MSINPDSSAGKAVASRLVLNKKTKYVQLRFLYIQDIVQRGEMTKNPNNSQSSRRVDKASTSNNNSVTFGATLSTDDTTDSQRTTRFNIGKDDNWNDPQQTMKQAQQQKPEP
eukprot:1295735-Amphidinium_carterae.6